MDCHPRLIPIFPSYRLHFGNVGLAWKAQTANHDIVGDEPCLLLVSIWMASCIAIVYMRGLDCWLKNAHFRQRGSAQTMAESKFNHKFRITWCFQISRFHYRIFEFGFTQILNSVELDTYGLLLPVGISFYTFQTMSYTIDIYRRKQNPMIRLLISLATQRFPQLVAGPIVRSDHFRKEIEKPPRVDSARFRLD